MVGPIKKGGGHWPIAARALGALAEISMGQCLLVEENTEHVLHASLRRVSQVVEPEAEWLLVSRGGSVSGRGGMIYDEYTAPDFPTIAADFPAGTRCVYVSPLGQEDRQVLFAIFSLPGYAGELHLVYDYRLSVPISDLLNLFSHFTSRVNRSAASLAVASRRRPGGNKQLS